MRTDFSDTWQIAPGQAKILCSLRLVGDGNGNASLDPSEFNNLPVAEQLDIACLLIETACVNGANMCARAASDASDHKAQLADAQARISDLESELAMARAGAVYSD